MGNGDRLEYAFYTSLCCCGLLPILALVKFTITLPLSVLVNFVGPLLLTIYWLPVNIFFSARTIVQTPYWGIKLKILLLLLPAASLASLPLVILGFALFCFVCPLFISFGTSFGVYPVKDRDQTLDYLFLPVAVGKE